MAMVALQCSNCRGSIQLDDTKEFGFCIYCGHRFLVQPEIQKVRMTGTVRVDHTETYYNYMKIAADAYAACNYAEAYSYYTRALEITANDHTAMYRKALCAGYLSGPLNPRSDEVVHGLQRGFGLAAGDLDKIKLISKEMVSFTMYFYPVGHLRKDTFIDYSECRNYVTALFNAILLTERVQALVPSSICDDDKEELLAHLITLCDGIEKNRSFRYKDGYAVDKKGQRTPKISTYNPDASMRSQVSAIRAAAVEMYNNLPRIQEQVRKFQVDIDRYNLEIGEHRARVADVWSAHPEAHKRYKKASILYMVGAVPAFFTVVGGFMVLYLRSKRMKEIRNEVYSAELLQEAQQIKEVEKELKKRTSELEAYKKTAFKK
jgi:DNA-directed RNA polymerase subunit RPC12/RpoP